MKLPGFVKSHFMEQYQKAPWKTSQPDQFYSPWPFLVDLLQSHRITYFDFLLTHQLLKNATKCPQNCALLICHLVLSARKSHVCSKIDRSSLTFSVPCLWASEESSLLTPEEISRLVEMILNGAELIPNELLTEVKADCVDKIPSTPICRCGNNLYLQKQWVLESILLKNLISYLDAPLSLKFDQKPIRDVLSSWQRHNIVNQEQSEAILGSINVTCSIISGGPGTGKTYTAGRMIRLIWDHLSEQERSHFKIVLAAPTGKAAANLFKSLSTATTDLPNFPQLEAKTLHALLELNRAEADSEVRLNADLLMVDESSMIDLKTMAKLFKSIKKGSRLVFLGDPFQLPSVDSGNIFHDLIQLNLIPHNQLKTCLRAELLSIIQFAEIVKSGDFKQVFQFLNESMKGITKKELPHPPKQGQNEILKHVISHFKVFLDHEIDSKIGLQLLQKFNQIRLLSPLRKGPFGADLLNEIIGDHIETCSPDNGWMAIPILIGVNDYKLNLFNGDTGILIRKLPLQEFSNQDYAFFPSRTTSEPRKIPAVLLPKYEKAYCLSIYKSQGSEFDQVILVLPEGSEGFGRASLYTAITRAKQRVDIYASDHTLTQTLLNQDIRLSGLQERIKLMG